MPAALTPERVLFALLALLSAQAFAVRDIVGLERLPPTPDLDRFPRAVAGWQAYRDLPIPAGTLAVLGADRVLERLYYDRATAHSADLFLAWFQSQRGGRTQPHSPKVCLPGSGWLTLENREVTLDTAAGAIPANRYVVANRGRRAEVLYWYQTPRRVLAGEWEAKFFTLVDGWRDRRTDTALVRVLVMARPDGGETEAAARFSRLIYPPLRGALPR